MGSWQPYVETYAIPAQLALAMLGMGATLRPRDFLAVVRDPRGLALGFLLQVALVPAIAVGFAQVFGMTAGWAVGLFLVAVVPGGAFSNLLTFLGRGNTALSISITLLSTSLCVITVPLILRLVAAAHLPDNFSFPTHRIVLEIGAYLIAPLCAGMVCLRLLPGFAEGLSKWSIRLSVALIILITVVSVGSGRIKVGEYGWVPPARILLFAVALVAMIPHLCRLFGRYDEDTLAIGIEVIVRNVGVGLLLIRFFFPGTETQGHVLYTCLFYAGISGFFAVPQVLLHRYGRSPVFLRAPKRRKPVDEPVWSDHREVGE